MFLENNSVLWGLMKVISWLWVSHAIQILQWKVLIKFTMMIVGYYGWTRLNFSMKTVGYYGWTPGMNYIKLSHDDCRNIMNKLD